MDIEFLLSASVSPSESFCIYIMRWKRTNRLSCDKVRSISIGYQFSRSCLGSLDIGFGGKGCTFLVHANKISNKLDISW